MQLVRRSLAVLRHLGRHRSGVTPQELATELDIPMPDVLPCGGPARILLADRDEQDATHADNTGDQCAATHT